MGFSPQSTHFRPSSFRPPYFWFCRSSTQFSPFSTSGRTFCRLEDRAPQSANVANGAINSDLLALNQRSRYSTFQNNERELHNRQRNNFAFPQLEKPSVHREAERREDANEASLYGIFGPGQTVEDWGKATEEYKRNKRLFTHGNSTSANLRTVQDEAIAEKVNSNGKKIVRDSSLTPAEIISLY
ncbi:hypothetical protein MIMGU_mgv1a014616mg [Erythranthe guttata]|uniref:Uncharacterized protein n=1 Tax=Erythranthe guttata TaxID=4155 RepID=A0A022QYD5_ERYGU|nr:hypothetical protein MIMGU_mgv1a014616mg [Erythranthe guttata]